MTPAHPNLFTDVQRRLDLAREQVHALNAAEQVKYLALRRLQWLDHASRFNLSIASREVAAFLADLDAGVIPIYDSERPVGVGHVRSSGSGR